MLIQKKKQKTFGLMLPSLFFPLLFKKIFIRKFERFWKIGDEDNQFSLFELNRSRWFAGQVVEYAVYASDLINNSAHYCL